MNEGVVGIQIDGGGGKADGKVGRFSLTIVNMRLRRFRNRVKPRLLPY